MEFHEKLQELRNQKGLTQEELAAELYVSRTAVSKWESGRGYPNIDSLKALARTFGVTVDALLSSDELLTIAEEDHKQNTTHFCDLMQGLLDIAVAMLLFLPFFAQRSDGLVEAVSLLSYDGNLKRLYVLFVIGTSLWGILALALQNCQRVLWCISKRAGSWILSAVMVLLFIVSLQPYAAVFSLVLLTIKVLTGLKR